MTVGIKWFIFCGVLVAGEALAFVLPWLHAAWPLAVCAGGAMSLYAFGRKWHGWSVPVVFCLGAALAWGRIAERSAVLAELTELNRGRPVESVFKVPASLRRYEEKKGWIKTAFPGEVRGVDVTVNLYLPSDTALPEAGEVWACTGWMGRSSRGGLFGRRRFWVRGRGSAARRVSVHGDEWLDGVVGCVRDDLARRVGAGLAVDSEITALNRALLLGGRADMDRATRASFAASGTAHLFAVSGLHVLVIGKFLSILLSLSGFPSRFKAFVLVPLIWFYVLIVGAGPSSVRAAMMATLYWSAALFWRRSDPLVAWAQTFALVHVASPVNLVSVASQLSFAVMLGLVSWNRIAAGLKDGVLKLLAPTAVAWASGVPIIAATFAVITPGGLIANLIAVPVAAFSVMLTAAGALSSYVSTAVAGVFNAAAYMTTSVTIGLARVTAAVRWSNFEVEPWSFLNCAVWYCAVAVVLLLIHSHFHRPAVRI